jgi:hypothetical protein
MGKLSILYLLKVVTNSPQGGSDGADFRRKEQCSG